MVCTSFGVLVDRYSRLKSQADDGLDSRGDEEETRPFGGEEVQLAPASASRCGLAHGGYSIAESGVDVGLLIVGLLVGCASDGRVSGQKRPARVLSESQFGRC